MTAQGLPVLVTLRVSPAMMPPTVTIAPSSQDSGEVGDGGVGAGAEDVFDAQQRDGR